MQSGQIGTMAGAPLAVVIEMGFVEFAKGRVGRVRAFRPVGDMTVAGCSLDARQRLGDGENRTNAGAMRPSGIMPVRTSGKYIATSFTVPAGHVWNYIRAFEFEVEPGGLR
jgi:hypothetical protein